MNTDIFFDFGQDRYIWRGREISRVQAYEALGQLTQTGRLTCPIDTFGKCLSLTISFSPRETVPGSLVSASDP